MKKEIKLQDLCSDNDNVIVMSFTIIAAGVALMVLCFMLMYIAALFS